MRINRNTLFYRRGNSKCFTFHANLLRVWGWIERSSLRSPAHSYNSKSAFVKAFYGSVDSRYAISVFCADWYLLTETNLGGFGHPFLFGLTKIVIRE
jgi:hypothetical protein